MPLTDSLYTVADALYQRLVTDKASLGLKDVWYGAGDLIPRTPAVDIESDTKERDVVETGMMVRNEFTVFVTVLHSKLQDTSTTRREVDQLAEAVEASLHSDRTFGGLLVHSYVRQIGAGFATRGQAIIKASRLTWVGFSKTRLT